MAVGRRNVARIALTVGAAGSAARSPSRPTMRWRRACRALLKAIIIADKSRFVAKAAAYKLLFAAFLTVFASAGYGLAALLFQ